MIKLPKEILLEIFKYLDFKTLNRKKELNKMILRLINNKNDFLFINFLLNNDYIITKNENNITFNRKNRSLSFEKNMISNIDLYKILFNI